MINKNLYYFIYFISFNNNLNYIIKTNNLCNKQSFRKLIINKN